MARHKASESKSDAPVVITTDTATIDVRHPSGDDVNVDVATSVGTLQFRGGVAVVPAEWSDKLREWGYID